MLVWVPAGGQVAARALGQPAGARGRSRPRPLPCAGGSGRRRVPARSPSWYGAVGVLRDLRRIVAAAWKTSTAARAWRQSNVALGRARPAARAASSSPFRGSAARGASRPWDPPTARPTCPSRDRFPCPSSTSRRSPKRRRRARAPQLARSRAARRALGLPALLARRAPQHAGHRERGDRGRDRRTSPRGTSTIRVGAGGIMLPNHAPLVIAEQFGTLESLYPGPHRSRPRPRAGHRPGHGARAPPQRSRRTPTTFPQDVVELMRYFEPAQPGQQVVRGARRRARRCRSGFSARACSARSSRRARAAVRVRVALRAGAS